MALMKGFKLGPYEIVGARQSYAYTAYYQVSSLFVSEGQAVTSPSASLRASSPLRRR
jgi:hypothetical protein